MSKNGYKQHQDTISNGAIGNHRSELVVVVLFTIRLLGIFWFVPFVSLCMDDLLHLLCVTETSTSANGRTVFK